MTAMLRYNLVPAQLALCVPAFAQDVTGSLPPASAAATTPALKSAVTVSSDLVRIGDLIDNAGASARVPIFRAPDLGQTGMVSAARVIEAVRPHGFPIVETRGVAEVAVTRATRVIDVKEIEQRIAAALAAPAGVGDARHRTVAIDADARPLRLDPSAAGELTATRVFYDPRSTRFDVTFEIGGATRRAPLR